MRKAYQEKWDREEEMMLYKLKDEAEKENRSASIEQLLDYLAKFDAPPRPPSMPAATKVKMGGLQQMSKIATDLEAIDVGRLQQDAPPDVQRVGTAVWGG